MPVGRTCLLLAPALEAGSATSCSDRWQVQQVRVLTLAGDRAVDLLGRLGLASINVAEAKTAGIDEDRVWLRGGYPDARPLSSLAFAVHPGDAGTPVDHGNSPGWPNSLGLNDPSG